MAFIDFSLIQRSFIYVISGLPYTLGIATLSFTTGLFLGIILAILGRSQSKIIRSLVKSYVSLMRGIPMIVVLFMLYFGIPYYGIQLPALLCAYIGFSSVSSAYISEIFVPLLRQLMLDNGKQQKH